MYLVATCSRMSESSAFRHCAAQCSGDDSSFTASAHSRCLGEGTLLPGSAGSGGAPRGCGWAVSGEFKSCRVPCALPTSQSPHSAPLAHCNFSVLIKLRDLSKFQSLIHSQAGSRNRCMSGEEWRYYPFCLGVGRRGK